MSVVALAAAVVLGVQVIKNGLKSLGLVIQGWGSVLLAIAASLAVVAFEAVRLGIPFTLALGWIFLQVAFYALTGKFFISQVTEKIANGKTTPPTT